MSNRLLAILTRPGTTFTVASSPLNGVKLELGLIICGAVLLAFVQGLWIDSALAQVAVLGAYGCLAATWVVCRVRRVLRAVRAGADTVQPIDGQE